jgi:hypothetical protein
MSRNAVKRDREIIVDAVGSWRTDRVLLTEQDALRLRETLARALLDSMTSARGPRETRSSCSRQRCGARSSFRPTACPPKS